jgi:cell division protein FtsW (lipid II flippase)
VSYPLLALVVGMLIFVLIPLVPEAIVRPRNGARRWINLGVTDFQPSELAKIAYVLALASYLRFRSNYRRLFGLLLPLGLTFVPMGLILIEPDLGTAMLFLPTLFAMLIAAGAKLRQLALVIALGLALAPAMYPLLKPHQKDRIRAMTAQVIGDTRYEQDIGFQGARAMTLAGAGGLTGVGRRQAAALVTYNGLPEDHNDMIFAVIACRWGLLGALATWGGFLALCAGGLAIAAQGKDPFGRLVPVGITAAIFAQMTINTGMVIGVMPITGMTLPFVSYGGSSLVSAWIMVGLLLNIAMRRQRYLAREAFEFGDEA